jgi:hypothetical protein
MDIMKNLAREKILNFILLCQLETLEAGAVAPCCIRHPSLWISTAGSSVCSGLATPGWECIFKLLGKSVKKWQAFSSFNLTIRCSLRVEEILGGQGIQACSVLMGALLHVFHAFYGKQIASFWVHYFRTVISFFFLFFIVYFKVNYQMSLNGQ